MPFFVGGHKMEHQTAGYQPNFCMCAGGDRRAEVKSVLAHRGRLFSEKENVLCGLFS